MNASGECGRSPSRAKPCSYVSSRLEAQTESIAEHFGIKLASFEKPQFLCYRVGDFFVAHQDGNTGLIQLETDQTRRVSVSIFLNSQSAVQAPETYCGGALVFSDWRTGSQHEVVGEAGMLVAFRSELTHEVTQVTHGERFAVVSWLESMIHEHYLALPAKVLGFPSLAAKKHSSFRQARCVSISLTK